jgi:cytochrome b561
MKKIILLLIVLAVIITGVVLYSSDSLQTQVLRTTDDQTRQEVQKTPNDCKKMSETLANECLKEIALREKDASYCSEITKVPDQRKCEREVRLAP